ncbi:MAG: CotH kinase family protein [Sedimentisphaerales bacterium]|nr:CotH kinase family protein [Sedimentisphaerales bacterium]
MQIKRQNNHWIRRERGSSQNRRIVGIVRYLIILGVYLGSCLACAYYGPVILRGLCRARTAVLGLISSPEHIRYHTRGLFADIERININIKHKNFQKLAYQRAQALEGRREFVDFEYIPASIDYRTTRIPVKIRLKGDRDIHYIDDQQWSFRIQTKQDNTMWGMKRFSIHRPLARNYIYEWLFHEMLKKEDVLALRYKYIDVNLNGKNLGIYAVEEHFEKRLLEYQQRREGPIIRFNEDLGENLAISAIEPFEQDKWTTPENRPLLQKAIDLLEAYRQGELKTSDVFDIKKLATFFAVTDLLGAHHGALWKSMRFYYNPLNGRLEPIGFDGHGNGSPENVTLCAELGINPQASLYESFGEWFRFIFNDADSFDAEFFREYVRALERISQKPYLDHFFEQIAPELEQNLVLIHKEFPLWEDQVSSFGPGYYGPGFFEFSREALYKRQQMIRDIFKDPRQRIHAYFMEIDDNSLAVQVGNTNTMPIEIVDIRYSDTMTLPLAEPVILLPREQSCDPSEVPAYHNIRFALPVDFSKSAVQPAEMKMSYRILGEYGLRQAEIYLWQTMQPNAHVDDIIRRKPNAREFGFLKCNEAERVISVLPGEWRVDQDLILPAGYTITAGKGVHLDLSGKAVILTYSPLEFIGEVHHPIRIFSSDSTGRGIVVMNAEKSSHLEHVIFDNLSNPSEAGWILTGAITFYESDVDISYCEFLQSRSEDSLNIVRSKFNIEHTRFSHNSADALDADFSQGSIRDTSFVDCGNDAIDVSGSDLTLTNIIINQVGDKGISAGEKSTVKARTTNIKNAEIAVASKDLSQIILDDIVLSDCEIGFTPYQKKPEYGPAHITVTNLSRQNIQIPYMVEESSCLQVDGEPVVPNYTNVKDILYGVEYGKSSRPLPL